MDKFEHMDPDALDNTLKFIAEPDFVDTYRRFYSGEEMEDREIRMLYYLGLALSELQGVCRMGWDGDAEYVDSGELRLLTTGSLHEAFLAAQEYYESHHNLKSDSKSSGDSNSSTNILSPNFGGNTSVKDLTIDELLSIISQYLQTGKALESI